MHCFEDCKVSISDLLKILNKKSKEALGDMLNSETVDGDPSKLLKEIEKAERVVIEQALKIDDESIKGQLYLSMGYFRYKALELEYKRAKV